MDMTEAQDLLAFIDASPSPFHAVAESVRRLQAAGYRPLQEGDAWQLVPGDRVYVVRDGGTLAAFEIGSEPAEEHGFRLIGAHTDSPGLRIKPQPEVARDGYRQLAVEVYGGALYSTWLDRDLSIAGRVCVREAKGELSMHLVRLPGAPLRIPNLAIHLNRNANDSLQINAQQHLVPVWGLGDKNGFSLRDGLAQALTREGVRVAPEAVLGWDLALFPVEPSRVIGDGDVFLSAPRLDNLAGCHHALRALLNSGSNGKAPRARTRGVVLFDHEEVGSESARGAGSSLLRTLLSRVIEAHGAFSETRLARALSRSLFVSSDMAHGVHPNYADRHEPGHRPILGQGPVIKANSNARYATDGETWALVELLAEQAETKLQRFVVRSDLGCGSTIGPVTASSLGIRTVDIGSPMLSMHSSRELAAVADVAPMIRMLSAFLAG